MKIKIAWLALILAGVLFQASFLAVLFPQGQAPNVILLIIIAWTIVSGFEKIWPWALTAGIITDLIVFDPPGKNVILLVLASYFAGFLSNRFPIENRVGEIAAIFFTATAAIIFNASFDIFFASLEGISLKEQLQFLMKNSVVQIIAGAIWLYFFYAFFKKIENRLNYFNSRLKPDKL